MTGAALPEPSPPEPRLPEPSPPEPEPGPLPPGTVPEPILPAVSWPRRGAGGPAAALAGPPGTGGLPGSEFAEPELAGTGP